MVAFMYSPCTSTSKSSSKAKPNEKYEIMTSFYETEMPELDDTQDLINDSHQRRDSKKDPQDKAKERLWASIVSAADNDSESSDDDQI